MKHSEVKVLKSVDKPTGEKRYVPNIYYQGRSKPLRLSWKQRTLAEVYGNRIFERCVRMARTKLINSKEK